MTTLSPEWFSLVEKYQTTSLDFLHVSETEISWDVFALNHLINNQNWGSIEPSNLYLPYHYANKPLYV